MTAQAGGASPSSRSITGSTDRTQLRRRMRQARWALSRSEQQCAARQVAMHLTHAWTLRPNARIGIYLALPGELSLQPTIQRALALGCRLFVPHILSIDRGHMAFYAFNPAVQLRTNRWGIPQLPSILGQTPIKTIELDVVLVPMVAFDIHGHRLGMGAGFYDRHFARLTHEYAWRRPRLIGVGYSIQQAEFISPQPHDVNLDAVVTERGFITFGRAR